MNSYPCLKHYAYARNPASSLRGVFDKVGADLAVTSCCTCDC
ncbi:MAG TPA: hypothetical protein VEC36_04985 [Patescibacteria group bacterium]|nr:hypothetical protein [Patescibacteria group bacterium]